MARAREIDQRERHRGIGDVEDRLDALFIEPLAGDVEADVDLVLMIGDHHLDRLAEHRAAEILDRHLERLHRTRPGEIGVGAGLIVHDADGERAFGEGGDGEEAEGEGDGEAHGKGLVEAPECSAVCILCAIARRACCRAA